MLLINTIRDFLKIDLSIDYSIEKYKKNSSERNLIRSILLIDSTVVARSINLDRRVII